MSRRIVRIRKQIILPEKINPIIENYKRDIYNIGLIIPVTSNKRNYKSVEEIDFFRILISSFLKKYKKEGNYNYSFYLGYDDDDNFFIKNKEKIKTHFNSLIKDIENPIFKISLIEIKGLKSRVGEIWSRLADYASKENDYLYQLGDDICFLTSGWEDRFVKKLISKNNFGVVGPLDISSGRNLLTQSFVHVTHLQIFNTYYPKKIKNWYIDDWIHNIYSSCAENDIKVKNAGGKPRYNVENNRGLFQKVLKETQPILEEYKNSLKLEKVFYFKCKKEINFFHRRHKICWI